MLIHRPDSTITNISVCLLSMCIYLTCLADAVAVSSAACFNSDWVERRVVSDWTVYCCFVISVVLVTRCEEEQVTEDFAELCSGVDSVLDGVEVISWVTVCFSDDWMTVSLEAGSFARHGGLRVESEAGGCEAHFCITVSVAGDWGVLSGSVVSTVAGCCESGMTAGSLTAVC